MFVSSIASHGRLPRTCRSRCSGVRRSRTWRGTCPGPAREPARPRSRCNWRAGGRAHETGHALDAALGVPVQPMHPAVVRRQLRFDLGVLLRDARFKKQMTQRRPNPVGNARQDARLPEPISGSSTQCTSLSLFAIAVPNMVARSRIRQNSGRLATRLSLRLCPKSGDFGYCSSQRTPSRASVPPRGRPPRSRLGHGSPSLSGRALHRGRGNHRGPRKSPSEAATSQARYKSYCFTTITHNRFSNVSGIRPFQTSAIS